MIFVKSSKQQVSREFIREDYLKLDIKFTPVLPAREIAIAYLSELDFEVFETTKFGLMAHIPNLNIDRDLLNEAKAKLEAIADDMVWAESIVETENWNAKWEEEYEPVKVEDRVVVRAPFHTKSDALLDVVIKPNMSFGTGHHDTTWMMIKAMLGLELKGSVVLDMGCGTGVLAIVAKLLGAERVLAIDIEEGAVGNTIENAALNGVCIDEDFTIDCGTSELLASKYNGLNNIILANINRNVLIDDMSSYNQVLKQGGSIVFSGFFSGDVEIMKIKIQALNWTITSTLERNGWACIICGKPAL
ncbi:MAG: 50S ribosomal protein L11 methyltransferase [Bacteroidota bacterium]|nr:50S ribosomal protein L11 methyltransferase [Bacteroidota bacterium]